MSFEAKLVDVHQKRQVKAHMPLLCQFDMRPLQPSPQFSEFGLAAGSLILRDVDQVEIKFEIQTKNREPKPKLKLFLVMECAKF